MTVTRSRLREVIWRGALGLIARLPDRAYGWLSTIVELASVERFLRGLPRAPGVTVQSRSDVYDAILAEVGAGPIAYAEFGVHEGASIRYFSERHHEPASRFVGFDSFEGLPEDWNAANPAGTFSTEGRLPTIRDDRVSFVPGWFEDTVPRHDFASAARYVVNIDCDLYSSTQIVLAAVGPHLTRGDILYFDELADVAHEFKALLEWQAQAGRPLSLLARTRHPHHVALRVDA